MKTGLLVGIVAAAFAVNAQAKDTAGLKTDKQKFSYTVGSQIGQNVKRQNLDLDAKTFGQGIQDAVAGTPPKMSNEEMQAAMQAYHKKEQEKREALGKKNKEAGEAFLEANKKKKDVVALPSGVQYKIVKEGSGKKPALTDSVTAHYRGTLIDGTEFDSSIKRNEPATFPLNGVIKGWQEVLPLMKEGSKWEVFIPASLGYGEQGTGGGPIGPNATLIFEIELISVKDPAAAKEAPKDAPKDALKENAKEKESKDGKKSDDKN